MADYHPSMAENSAQAKASNYDMQHGLYVDFVDKLRRLLSELMDADDVRFHVIEGRAKEPQSVTEKLARPGKHYGDFTAMPDLAGLRAVTYTIDECASACSIVEREFDVDPRQSGDKVEDLGADRFGYLSVHKVVRLSASRLALPEWSRFSGMQAEIQIRSVLQHSWAVVSHRMQYKREGDVPLPFRRKLMRLAALLELADEQFAQLIQEERDLASALPARIRSDADKVLLDAMSVSEYVRTSSEVAAVVDAAHTAGLEERGEIRELDRLGSQLLLVATAMGLESISTLSENIRAAVESASIVFEGLAKTYPGAAGSSDHWAAVLLIAYDRGATVAPETLPWNNPDYLECILAAGREAFDLG